MISSNNSKEIAEKIKSIRQLIELHPNGSYAVFLENKSEGAWTIDGKLLLGILDALEVCKKALEEAIDDMEEIKYNAGTNLCTTPLKKARKTLREVFGEEK